MCNGQEIQREQRTVGVQGRDFPSLYQSADQSSLSAQWRYLCLQKCHMGSLILGSVGAAIVTIVPVTAVTWIPKVIRRRFPKTYVVSGAERPVAS